jgi:hypothetical protein
MLNAKIYEGEKMRSQYTKLLTKWPKHKNGPSGLYKFNEVKDNDRKASVPSQVLSARDMGVSPLIPGLEEI